MIKLTADAGGFRFSIDGGSYAKGSVRFDINKTDETVTMVYGDTILYENVLYSDIVDEIDNPYPSLVELIKWLDLNTQELLPNAIGRKVISDGSINSIVLKKSPGILYAITAVNKGTDPVYLKVYDLNDSPDNDSVPILTLPLLSSTVYDTNMFPTPVQFYYGISILIVENLSEGGAPTEPVAGDIIANLIWR